MDPNYLRLAQLMTNKLSTTTIIDSILKEKSINYQIPPNSIKDLKNKGLEGSTALHILIQDFNVYAAKRLIQNNADFTIQNSIGETALHQAVIRTHFTKTKIVISLMPVVNAIFDAHVKLEISKNPSDKKGLSHFHAACAVNHEAATKFFIQKGVDVNQAVNLDSPNVPGYTPLHLAAKYSNLEIFKVLLDQGGDVGLKNADGSSPVHLLIQKNITIAYWMEIEQISVTNTEKQTFEKNKKMLRLVLDKHQNGLLDDTELSYFHVLCTLQNSSEVEEFLSSNDVDLNHSVKSDSLTWPGYTALHFAAQFSIETVKLLLNRGANIMAKDAKGTTPFDLCLKFYKTEDIHFIVESQPDWKNIMLTDGMTSLLQLLDAMKNENSFEIFVQTIDIYSSIPQSSPIWPGCTPLHLAIALAERVQGNEIHTLYVERIRILINAAADITATDATGSTPLHTAFRLRKFKVITLLLQANPFLFDLVDEDNVSHLQIVCAAGNLNAVQMIFQTGCANINIPLSLDCEFERVNEVNLAETSYFFPAGSTPLHIAVITKDIEMARTLVLNGADVHAQDSKELTPIHRLLTHKYAADIKTIAGILFAVDNLKDVVTSFVFSHLHIACWVNEKAAVTKLLDQGVDVNIRLLDVSKLTPTEQKDKQLQFLSTYRFYKPFNFAYCRKKSDVMDIVFQRNTDIIGDPKNILDAARHTTKFNTFEKFSKVHAITLKRWDDQQKVTSLHAACYQLDVASVEELLKQGADPNAKVTSTLAFWNGFTPFHVLFQVRSWKEDKINAIAKLLINYGADVTTKDLKGATAIHQIVDTFNIKKKETLRILVEGQKDFTVNPGADNGKISHFHAACICNAVSIVEKFLQNGSDVNLKVDPMSLAFGGYMPLHLAAYFRAKETFNFLLKHGADVQAQNRAGNTALHLVVGLQKHKATLRLTKDIEICKPLVMRLVGAGADVNTVNVSGETPLERFLKTQQPTNDMLQILSKNQRRVNNFNSGDGKGYIATAIKKLTNIKDIQEHPVYQAVITSPRINENEKDGRNPIHNIVSITKIAAPTKVYIKAIEGFLKAGFDINQPNKKGQTPLHIAVNFYNSKAVAALLTLGANINLLCNGETSLSFHWKIWKKIPKNKLYEKERQIINLLVKQVNKLQLINFEVTAMDKTVETELQERQWQMDFKVIEQCQVELERLETRKIGQSDIDWWSFLSETGIIAAFPNLRQIERQAICDVFEKQSFRFHNEFPEFAGILYMQYGKAVKRMSLIQPSKVALHSLIDCILPDLCSERVFRFLTNTDLVNLIDAKEKLVAHKEKRQKTE